MMMAGISEKDHKKIVDEDKNSWDFAFQAH